MTSIAGCDPGTLDINGKVQIAVYDTAKAPLFPAISLSPGSSKENCNGTRYFGTAEPPAAPLWSFPARWRPGLTACR